MLCVVVISLHILILISELSCYQVISLGYAVHLHSGPKGWQDYSIALKKALCLK